MLLFSRDFTVGLSSPAGRKGKKGKGRRQRGRVQLFRKPQSGGKASMAGDSNTDQSYWGKKRNRNLGVKRGKENRSANPTTKQKIQARMIGRSRPSPWIIMPKHRKPHSLLSTYWQNRMRMTGAKAPGGLQSGTGVLLFKLEQWLHGIPSRTNRRS